MKKQPAMAIPTERIQQAICSQFAVVFDAIRKLMEPPRDPRREMGYHTLIPKTK